MKRKIKSAFEFHKYICKQLPQYSHLYNAALIRDIKRVIKS